MRGRERRRARAARLRRTLAAGAITLAGFGLGTVLAPHGLQALGARRPEALRVHRVAVVGTERLAPAQVAAAAGIPLAASLTALDVRVLRERLAAHAWVARARVVALPPSTLLLGVEERRPVAWVSGEREERPLLVDRDAVPFAAADREATERLPRLVAGRPARLGQRDAALARALAIADALAGWALPAPREVALVGATPAEPPVVRLRGLEARVVLGAGDLEHKLERLARLLAADRPELAEAEGIDLRFAERAILAVQPSRTGTDQRRTGAGAPGRPTKAPSGDPGGAVQGG